MTGNQFNLFLEISHVRTKERVRKDVLTLFVYF